MMQASALAAALARAEAAEKERDEARENAQGAQTAMAGYVWALNAAEARCATLEAALREIAGDGGRVYSIVLADRARAALAAATPPAEPPRFFCEGGTDSCDMCVGSCGIEEYEESLATPPAEEEVVAAASVLGLSREETDELVRLARSEGIRTQPAEKEGTA